MTENRQQLPQNLKNNNKEMDNNKIAMKYSHRQKITQKDEQFPKREEK